MTVDRALAELLVWVITNGIWVLFLLPPAFLAALVYAAVQRRRAGRCADEASRLQLEKDRLWDLVIDARMHSDPELRRQVNLWRARAEAEATRAASLAEDVTMLGEAMARASDDVKLIQLELQTPWEEEANR